MWRSAGLFRTREGLAEAVSRLDAEYECDRRRGDLDLSAEDARRVNLVTVARLIARAALRREESRGAHYRQDFPNRDDARWRIHVCDIRGAE